MPLGTFVASMSMVATNEFGSETINLVGLGGIIPPPQPIPEFSTGLLMPTLMGALVIASLIFRRINDRMKSHAV